MNKVILIGMLSEDPKAFEYKGLKGCELKIVVQQNDLQQNNYPRDPYIFQVNLWNKNLDYAMDFLRKNDLVSIEGYLKSEIQQSTNGKEYLRLSISTEKIRKIPLSFNKSGNRSLPNEYKFNRMDQTLYNSFNKSNYDSYSNDNNRFSNEDYFEPPATTEIKDYRESHDIEDIKKIEPQEFAKFKTPSNFNPKRNLIDDEDDNDSDSDDGFMSIDDWMNDKK
ncbi:single-stranded DNA-binding protein [Mycoplasma sp. T363T]|uniref:Single-stranded DNA-binding protein n=1 Tax=Mycoplasma bradburyae TaxID=2963128 RepID=A0AAW6HMP9_9MOLU|nr:single-stranded DNA-binding protein [Mycoplasma bradburyae]MDC4162981.1 single-stranded DNA-binding protein [Mycoplasma bradburyae]MDC4181592.1 single-stranded DNA-binding protein [Mycoplasma bradburyae]MDC4182318.1 single-stranded DNA-binding protein [Mycoplasma bradburyae]MDC4183045.1 single-stranded DNA-binding protein [Mycoplasma bradburyae]UTS69985.1 single-stranded DNA-binding protein [Mycoplasma bradburyae]